MAANFEPILTIADLEAIPEDGNRYELIEGELFVSRAPSLGVFAYPPKKYIPGLKILFDVP